MTRIGVILGSTRPGRRGAQVADWVMEQLPGLVGRPGSDIVVETTLDLDMQRSAEDAVMNLLRTKTSGSEQGALIAMTTDGSVRALVGGRSYMTSEFNRATQATHEPWVACVRPREKAESPESDAVSGMTCVLGKKGG